MAQGHATEVHCGEQVSVCQKERFVQKVKHIAKRACGAERLVLVAIIEADPEFRTVAKIRFDQMSKMIDRDDDFTNSYGLHPSQKELENRHVAQRHQRFREQNRIRMQSRALAARHYDRLADETRRRLTGSIASIARLHHRGRGYVHARHRSRTNETRATTLE